VSSWLLRRSHALLERSTRVRQSSQGALDRALKVRAELLTRTTEAVNIAKAQAPITHYRKAS